MAHPPEQQTCPRAAAATAPCKQGKPGSAGHGVELAGQLSINHLLHHQRCACTHWRAGQALTRRGRCRHVGQRQNTPHPRHWCTRAGKRAGQAARHGWHAHQSVTLTLKSGGMRSEPCGSSRQLYLCVHGQLDGGVQGGTEGSEIDVGRGVRRAAGSGGLARSSQREPQHPHPVASRARVRLVHRLPLQRTVIPTHGRTQTHTHTPAPQLTPGPGKSAAAPWAVCCRRLGCAPWTPQAGPRTWTRREGEGGLGIRGGELDQQGGDRRWPPASRAQPC